MELEIPLRLDEGASAPEYATTGAAGMDLRAAETVSLAPGERKAVRTGLRIAIPPGYEGQVRPRSGLALRHGLSMVNSPGTIDCDYRGEIAVILINHGSQAVELGRGERVGQLVVAPVVRVRWRVVSALEDTERGAGGFGHTGTA